MIKEALNNLIDNGLTEDRIVELLYEMGIDTTQPTINRIKTGKIASPKYDIGAAILELKKKKPRAQKQVE